MSGENTENKIHDKYIQIDNWEHTNLRNTVKSELSAEFEAWLNERVKSIPNSDKVLYQGEEKSIGEMFEIYKFIKSNN